MARTALDDPRYYLNRHVQWLEFNRRVLEEARDIGNPLLERVEVLFPLKDSQLCERVCNEILSSYLADTRNARILASDGSYSRPRAARNGRGFSVQEHLMRIAEGAADAAAGNSARTRVLLAPAVVYTPNGATSPSSGEAAEPETQDSTNAIV